MAIVIGIVGVYFVNWLIARQGDDSWVRTIGWRLMLGSASIPALALLVLLTRVPESPRWLVLNRREAEAETLLRQLGGAREAAEAIREIRAASGERRRPLLSFGLGVLTVGIVVSVLQQAVGINAVLYYAPEIFRNMGATGEHALLQTVLVGSVNLLATLVAIFTVDRWGRKPLLILGAAVMAVSMFALTFCFQQRQLGLGALLAMLVYTAGFALSWGPVTWVLLSEIFPTSIKGKALSIAVAAQWIANIAVSWSFKLIDGNAGLNAVFHHGFAYLLYGLMSVFALVFVAIRVPETKGRSLEAIEDFWKRESVR